MTDAKLNPLTAQESVLVLVDYQPGMFNGISSGTAQQSREPLSQLLRQRAFCMCPSS
jgi:hypothetical protein